MTRWRKSGKRVRLGSGGRMNDTFCCCEAAECGGCQESVPPSQMQVVIDGFAGGPGAGCTPFDEDCSLWSGTYVLDFISGNFFGCTYRLDICTDTVITCNTDLEIIGRFTLVFGSNGILSLSVGTTFKCDPPSYTTRYIFETRQPSVPNCSTVSELVVPLVFDNFGGNFCDGTAATATINAI